MSVEDDIRRKLTEAFAPTALEVENDSARHAGHAHMRAARTTHDASGETHFNVRITARAFAGQSRLARQRLVYGVLKIELAGSVHALSIKAFAPAEAG